MARCRSFLIALLLLAVCLPSFAFEHDDSDAQTQADAAPPLRPPAPPSANDLEKDKRFLKDEPIGPGWWQAAHRVLGEFLKKRETYETSVDALVKELGGEKGNLFKALSQARVNDDGEQLRKTAYEGANPDREAAKQENLRRQADPNTKLISENFPRRPELAAIDAVKLLKAKSDAEAAPVIAFLMGMIKRPQREALKKKTDDLLAQEGGPEKSGLDRKLVQRLNEGLKVSLGETPTTDFQKAVKGPYDQVLADNRELWKLAPKAMAGDKAAQNAIIAGWGKEALLDIAGDLFKNGNDGEGTALVSAVATNDGKGNLSLGLVAKNLNFGEKDRNQVVQLGNVSNPEQISAALAAMHTATVGDHSGLGKLGVSNPLQAYEIDTSPPDNAARFFAAKGDSPKLTRRTEAGPAPVDQLATRPIRTPVVLETPPPPTPTVTVTPTPTKTTPPSDQTRLMNALNQAHTQFCISCHASGKFEIEDGKIRLRNDKGSFDARGVQNALNKVPMGAYKDGEFGALLRQWLDLR